MFDIPGFNVAAMTDEELLQKQEKILARVVFASRFSNGGEMTMQLQRMNDAISGERLSRIQKKMAQDSFSSGPVIVDTDPDPDAPDQNAPTKTVQVRTPSMRRTSKPTTSD